MLPSRHFILGLILGAILFPYIGLLGAILVWFSSFLIDFDHYLWFIFIKRDFSLKKAYKWHILKRDKMRELSIEERKKHKNEILIFHGFEAVLVVYLLSYFWQPFIFVMVGMIIHLVVDYYELISNRQRLDKVSIIWDALKYYNLKKLKL